MYIGRLGDGAAHDDGIYILLKETIDNSIDEFTMGCGKRIDVGADDESRRHPDRDGARLRPRHPAREPGGLRRQAEHRRQIRQRGLPAQRGPQRRRSQGRQCALVQLSRSRRFREDKTRMADFAAGNLLKDHGIKAVKGQKSGTFTTFTPDPEIFPNYSFKDEYIENLLWNYAYLNTGLTLTLQREALQIRERPARPAQPEDRRLDGLQGDPPEGFRTSSWRSSSPTRRSTARSTTPSPTASTPPRAAPIRQAFREAIVKCAARVLQEGLRRRRHPHRHHRGDLDPRAGADLRVADQDEARQPDDVAEWRRDDSQLRLRPAQEGAR